ncbi:Hydrolase (HAD superfamily) [Weissella jogaejeotgali]|uniref:Hydrolase (HAD superfamily) n=2 Tax=Weissella TaxID=46255 RepID=A0A1L6RCJ5_9LACO|nr:Cof-type HAD-IIB family hydrolase [Weissella jogaejeotgali]APS42218.1 Hydrolase (HAD superfamily) [Weissella jogaejeotgali]CCC57377.1 HAD superfamily hydrolase [Weissella thailandensis fsh4-2]
MSYKMLVSDLDETFLNDDGTIHKENMRAIKQATAKGFKFVPNTGRSFKSVQNMLKELGLFDQADQYVISYNGAAIVENHGNRVIATQDMPVSLAKQIVAAGYLSNQIDVHIYTVDKLFIYDLNESDKHYMATRGVTYEEINQLDLSFLDHEQPIMKVIFENEDATIQKQIHDAVLETVGSDSVEATYSSGRYVEFNLQGVDKGSASLLLGKRLDIKPSEIMAAGDNNNDLKMINAVGLGVSVANGITSVKAAADFVTQRTNNEGAIAEILDQFVLVGED